MSPRDPITIAAARCSSAVSSTVIHTGPLGTFALSSSALSRHRWVFHYDVRGIPVLVLLRDGAEVDRLVGAVPGPQLEAWIERHLGAPAVEA